MYTPYSRTLTTTLTQAVEAWIALGEGSTHMDKKGHMFFEIERRLPINDADAPWWEILKAVPFSLLYEHASTRVLRWRCRNPVISEMFARTLLPHLGFLEQMKLGHMLEQIKVHRATKYEELGNFLLVRRLELGLTQQELCRRMPVPLSPKILGYLEAGRHVPNEATSVALAQVLNLPGFPVFTHVYNVEVRRWARAINTILRKKRSSGSRTSARSTKSRSSRKSKGSRRGCLRIFSKLSKYHNKRGGRGGIPRRS